MTRFPLSSRAGFTLVEVIVGGAIASVVIITVLLLFRSTSTSLTFQQSRAGVNEAAEVAVGVTLQSARSAGMFASNDCSFVCSPEPRREEYANLSFCSLLGGRPYFIEFRVNDDEELEQVSLPLTGTGAATNVILQGLSGFRVEANDLGEWQADYGSLQSPPEAIRVDIDLAEGGKSSGMSWIPSGRVIKPRR